MIELNLAAKGASLKYEQNLRRNQMRTWRKCKVLTFDNENVFQQWLDYTKWHKRPIEKTFDDFGVLRVIFLDYKGA